MAAAQFPEVLIVEDDDVIRAMLVAALRREPLLVDSARDGVEALEKIGVSRFTVIVLDLMMPRMSGFDVLEVLAQQRPRPIVFVMTAYDDGAVRQLDGGIVHGIFKKPFDLERLVDVVRDCAALAREVGLVEPMFPPELDDPRIEPA